MLKIYEYTKEKNIWILLLELVNDCLKLAFNDEAVSKDDGTVELGSTDTIVNSSTFIIQTVLKNVE